MAKSKEEVLQFIELRAQGLSFQKISEQLGISKTTLLKWSTQHNGEVKEEQFYWTQAVLEQYQVLREARVRKFALLLSGILQELERRVEEKELKAVPTEKLMSMALKAEERLQKEVQSASLPVNVFSQELETLIFSPTSIKPE